MQQGVSTRKVFLYSDLGYFSEFTVRYLFFLYFMSLHQLTGASCFYCLVCLLSTLTSAINLTIRDRNFISGMHTPVNDTKVNDFGTLTFTLM